MDTSFSRVRLRSCDRCVERSSSPSQLKFRQTQHVKRCLGFWSVGSGGGSKGRFVSSLPIFPRGIKPGKLLLFEAWDKAAAKLENLGEHIQLNENEHIKVEQALVEIKA